MEVIPCLRVYYGDANGTQLSTTFPLNLSRFVLRREMERDRKHKLKELGMRPLYQVRVTPQSRRGGSHVAYMSYDATPQDVSNAILGHFAKEAALIVVRQNGKQIWPPLPPKRTAYRYHWKENA